MIMNVFFDYIRWMLLLAAVLFLTACGRQDPVEERARTVTSNTEKLIVGLAWPIDGAKGRLLEGAMLAQQHVNNSGGILGRELVFLMFNTQRSVDRGMIFAQRVADDPSVAAVIAHLDTYVAMPTSLVYDSAGVLMITPGASGMSLTTRGLDMVFRTFPYNSQQAEALADFALNRGYERVVTYYIGNVYGRDLANFFERRGEASGVYSVDRLSYSPVGTDHRRVMREWLRYQDFQPFDALFLAGSLPEGAQIIRQARQEGIDVPIFSGAGLDADLLMELGGEYVEGVVVTSVFSPELQTQQAIDFVDSYQRHFGEKPDAAAAQGYDAVMLLAEAARRAGSVDPRAMAAELRGSYRRWAEPWQGVTGSHRFTDTGDITDKQIVLNIVRDGQFHLLDIIRPN